MNDRLIDYLDVLAWPVVILTLVGGSMWLYRSNVAALVNRISTIHTPLATVSTSPEQPPPPELPADVTPPPNSADVTNTVQQLSAYVYWWYYEKMYRLTYGTQTTILAYLNSSPTGLDTAGVMALYNEHLRLARLFDPNYDRSFASYVGWLEGASLVTRGNNHYYITDIGRGFLAWMVAEGLTHKPGL